MKTNPKRSRSGGVSAAGRDVIISMSGHGAMALAHAVLLILLAKMIGPIAVGAYAIGLAITGPIFRFTRQSLRIVQASDMGRTHPLGHYALVATVTGILGIAISGGTAYGWQQDRTTTTVVFTVAVAASLTSLSEALYGSLQREGQFGRIASCQTLRAVAMIIGLVSGIKLTGTALGALTGLIVGHALVLVVADVPLARRATNQRSPSQPPASIARSVLSLTLHATPLGFAAFLTSLSNNVPRYFIQHHYGTHDLGIFAAIAMPVLAAYAFVQAAGHALQPRFSRAVTQGHARQFAFLAALTLLAGVTMGAGVLLIILMAGPQILALLFTPEYTQHQTTFVWIGIAGVFAYASWLAESALAGARRFFSFTWTTATGLVAGLVAAAVLVPSHGLVGAGQSMAAAFATTLVLRIAVLIDSVPKQDSRGAHVATPIMEERAL